jgi:hypothetical protein
VVGFCKHGRPNDPLVSIKDGQFLDNLSYCQLLKKDSDPSRPSYLR